MLNLLGAMALISLSMFEVSGIGTTGRTLVDLDLDELDEGLLVGFARTFV